jgi:DNA-binding MarR family transcriptional regulator
VAEQTNLGVLMFIASRSLEERAYDAAVAAGGTDVTVAQARLLARIAPGGTRLTDLAAQARVTKQTAGHLVDQLARTGYVERVPDPADGRARLVRLTARAEALVPAANAAVAEALAEWRTHLGEERMRHLEEALGMLREITDPWR